MAGFCHEQPVRGATNEWYTPPSLVRSLGVFQLDPCAPTRDHYTAKNCYTKDDNGLTKKWCGRVWLNPPYGPELSHWLKRLADHGQGTALVFARTETAWFFEHAWKRATAMLFLKGRVKFIRPNGQCGTNAAAPSVLIAYGSADASALLSSRLQGCFCTDFSVEDV